MDYEGYDYNDEDLSGLTIHDDLGSVNGELDAADAWLAQMESSAVSSGDGKSYQDELIGAATPEALQLSRIGHVEPRIQAGIKAILSGQNVAGIHPVDAAAAREQFASEIGGDPKKFARQIKLDEIVQPPRHEQDLKTVVSMLQNTSGEYMERGPGKQLPGNVFDSEKQAKSDEDLVKAIGYVKELADLYIDPRTVGSSVEGARRLAVEESLTKRFLESTSYTGSANVLPLPNETGVTGIVPTQGIYGSPQGTAEDRLSAGQFDEYYKTIGTGAKTQFVRDEKGFKVFREDVLHAQRSDILRRTPSLQNSLFPKPRATGRNKFTDEQLAKQGRDQKYAMEQAQYKADFARKILREQMPTTRDESKGQMRMSGWDTPYGEQADLQNLRNEAAIQGITWNDIYAGQDPEDSQSILTDYIEQTLEKEQEPISGGEIAQGTQAWLNQRKGKITASTAAGLLKAGGVQERAMELAMERLGTADPFTGNAHTREGNVGESKAASAFLSGPGRGLTMQEAFFETAKHRDDLEGFGISPDGRLYDDEGQSKGLLELKYLSSGSMKGALTKYTPQMQMQMAVTGESQTHFYALDKYTGEYVHEIVQADPTMQADLIEAGKEALELGAKLDNRGVQAMRKQIQSAKRKPRQKVGAENVKGQQESFESNVEADEPMTVFDAGAKNVRGIYDQGSGGVASETALARKLDQQDQSERMKDAVSSAMPDKGMSDEQKTEQRRSQAAARSTFADGNVRPAFGDATDNIGAEMANYYKQAQKEAADASKEASDSVRNFGAAVQKAGAVLGELGSAVMKGNASGMSEVRLAAETGQDVDVVRGTRKALEMGGVETGDASRLIAQSGNLAKTFNDEAKAADKYTSLMEARGKSNLESVRNMALPSIQEMQGMSPQQWTSTVANLMEGKTPQEKAQIGNIFGMTELATYDQDPATINQVDSSINGQNLRATNRGIVSVEQVKRDVLEQAGEIGEAGGAAANVASTGSSLASTATAGVLGAAGTKLMSGNVGRNLMTKATSVGSSMSARLAGIAGKGANLAKATPIGLAAGAIPMAARYGFGVKDDNSLGDSALDVAEMTAAGAAVGSVVPVVGTAVGAGVGFAAGLANEAWEYFSADDAVPDANIGAIQQQGQQATGKDRTIVNVEVTNEISPDLIRTTTDVDGEIDIDEETGLGTGG